MRRLLVAGSLALVLGVAGVSIVGCTPASGLQGARPAPETLPAEAWSWRLRTAAGEPFTLERHRGEVLFINVWATWCPPCVEELGSIERLARSLEGSGVTFLLVSPEERGVVVDFVRARSVGLPVAVEEERMPPVFGLQALPSTFVVDARGRIVVRHRGAAEWDRDDVRRALATLVDEAR